MGKKNSLEETWRDVQQREFQESVLSSFEYIETQLRYLNEDLYNKFDALELWVKRNEEQQSKFQETVYARFEYLDFVLFELKEDLDIEFGALEHNVIASYRHLADIEKEEAQHDATT